MRIQYLTICGFNYILPLYQTRLQYFTIVQAAACLEERTWKSVNSTDPKHEKSLAFTESTLHHSTLNCIKDIDYYQK